MPEGGGGLRTMKKRLHGVQVIKAVCILIQISPGLQKLVQISPGFNLQTPAQFVASFSM